MRSIIFGAAIATMLLALPVRAQDAAALAGTYCGKLWSAGEIVEAVTVLRAGSDGRLSGSYKFSDGNNDTPGGLLEEKVGTGLRRTLIWNDIYGTGKLVITFDTSLQGFTGLWGADWEEPDAQWDGSRCNSVISSLR